MPPRELEGLAEQITPLGVSIIVRSYNRLDACIELVEALLLQDYPNFEIVIVEQSTQKAAAQSARLEALAQRTNVRVLSRPPLGPPGARNEGCRHARNELLLFIDDDDIPISNQWIRQHVENYSDPNVIGVSGGDILSRDESLSVTPYKNLARARRYNISYTALGEPRCYPRLRERFESVGWLRGGNSSVRKSVVEATGGWDEDVVDHEEHSFSFKLKRRFPEQRLVFDPRPVILRRNDVTGGLDRRFVAAEATYQRAFDYFHRVYARYNRVRFVCQYPAYPALLFYMTASWIWDSSRSHKTIPKKVLGIARAALLSPLWFAKGWLRLLNAPWHA